MVSVAQRQYVTTASGLSDQNHCFWEKCSGWQCKFLYPHAEIIKLQFLYPHAEIIKLQNLEGTFVQFSSALLQKRSTLVEVPSDIVCLREFP